MNNNENKNWSSIGKHLDTILKAKRKANILNLLSGNIQISEIKKDKKIFEGIIKRFILEDISLFSSITSYNLRKSLPLLLTNTKSTCTLDLVFAQSMFLEHKVEKTNNQVSIKIGKDLLIISKNFKIPDVKIKFEGNIARKAAIKRCKYEIPLSMISSDYVGNFFFNTSPYRYDSSEGLVNWKNSWNLNKDSKNKYRVVEIPKNKSRLVEIPKNKSNKSSKVRYKID